MCSHSVLVRAQSPNRRTHLGAKGVSRAFHAHFLDGARSLCFPEHRQHGIPSLARGVSLQRASVEFARGPVYHAEDEFVPLLLAVPGLLLERCLGLPIQTVYGEVDPWAERLAYSRGPLVFELGSGPCRPGKPGPPCKSGSPCFPRPPPRLWRSVGYLLHMKIYHQLLTSWHSYMMNFNMNVKKRM